MFYQNANNIICNIQGNIIVVLIGAKKNVDGCTCPPHHPIILITAAELERGVGRDGLILMVKEILVFRRVGLGRLRVRGAVNFSLPFIYDLFMAPHGGAGLSRRAGCTVAICVAVWTAAMRVASLIHVRGE